jgi:hypothetical protein
VRVNKILVILVCFLSTTCAKVTRLRPRNPLPSSGEPQIADRGRDDPSLFLCGEIRTICRTITLEYCVSGPERRRVEPCIDDASEFIWIGDTDFDRHCHFSCPSGNDLFGAELRFSLGAWF